MKWYGWIGVLIIAPLLLASLYTGVRELWSADKEARAGAWVILALYVGLLLIAWATWIPR